MSDPEETEEYITLDASGYVVLAEGEELVQCDDPSNVIVLGEDSHGIVDDCEVIEEQYDTNMMIIEDGQMMYVEGVHDIVEEERVEVEVFQQEEVVDEAPPPVLSWTELEKKRKLLNVPKVPKKFLLYDGICAEIVDYDEQDGAPIVLFFMVTDDKEVDKYPVECGICPDIMHKSKLDAHLKTHLKAGTKRYKCIYCDDDFVTRAYAAGHARRHMGIRPYVCSPCTMYYCTKQDLKVHEQRRHMAKEHICEHCGKTFAQNTSLRHHRRLVHEQQRDYECERCGKKFLRKYAMKEHIRNVHYGDRRLLDCPFCEMRFKDTHKLAQHRKDKHLQSERFECRICGLEFNHIDFFDAHRRSLQCRKKLGRQLYQQKPDQNVEQREVLQQTRNQNHQLQQHELEAEHVTYSDESSQQMFYNDEDIKQEQLELQEVVVEEMTHDMHTEMLSEEEMDQFDDSENIEVDEHEKAKAEQQLLYELAAMDNA